MIIEYKGSIPEKTTLLKTEIQNKPLKLYIPFITFLVASPNTPVPFVNPKGFKITAAFTS